MPRLVAARLDPLLPRARRPYDHIGTVDTFQGKEAVAQGKEAVAVILVLGAQDEGQNGARQWAGSPANVAVSRAKQAFYVVGNRRLWRNAGSFGGISSRL